MLFNSIAFFIFFPVVTIFYYILPHRFRWLLLLIASCFFYMFFIPQYILILFSLIGIDFFAGLQIEKYKKRSKKRKLFLLLSILANIGILFAFKYFNFFNENIANIAHILHWNYPLTLLHIILPIGLSFHTFQSLSYVIEVYKGRQKAEKHLGIYALYVMFYPQLVAGPIERPQQMLPQFYIKHTFNPLQVTEGLQRMLIGFFKKSVIADNVAIITNQVYSMPHSYIGMPLILATIAFSIQIYADFSGYSDIAIGAAKVMGFTFVENFNYPYFSTSINNFWRKWHMSLYSWFRDYIYIPLGGSKKGLFLHMRNLLIVFMLSGLWHGAAWTFVIWGLLHGLFLSIATILDRIHSIKLPSFIKNSFGLIWTYILVTFAWVFFRANSLTDAWYIISHSVKGWGNFFNSIIHHNLEAVALYALHQGSGLGVPDSRLGILGLLLLFWIFVELLEKLQLIIKFPVWAKWTLYIGITLLILNMSPSNRMPFIYFQF